MSGVWHPTGRARVSQRSPSAIGVCQRCGMWYQRNELVPQLQWQGPKLQNIEVYVCTRTCLDKPQAQLKSIIIPADPVPVWRPFPEPFAAEVPNFLGTEDGNAITTETGDNLIWEDETTPLPDPNNPALYPP
ncbi:hypothetical protein IC762_12325 [Bradyrhizobium genosp. L]|uniref:hypothetical protein n=1 Tax=Bradyrhizobium genosp. L TaxID=83637 RepID=UPI0018A2EAEC|nr:hypothetical protein [Bradyrhizobium genosp. L]QPF87031.1 hypothetical protein IC762_12325 [Bradyrhizobium genosp. L]